MKNMSASVKSIETILIFYKAMNTWTAVHLLLQLQKGQDLKEYTETFTNLKSIRTMKLQSYNYKQPNKIGQLDELKIYSADSNTR